MVAHTRAAVGTHGLRPLGLPGRAIVEIGDAGMPVAVQRGRRMYGVQHIEEIWRVTEGWWREDAIARTYLRVLLDDGGVLTVFHDDHCAPSAGWYIQRYSGTR